MRTHHRTNHTGENLLPANSAYSEQDILRCNREHDQRHRWSVQFPSLYFNPPGGTEPGLPGFHRLQAQLGEEELTRRIWNWHRSRLDLKISA